MFHLDHACKIRNNTFIDDAGDLDIVILMYNLLEYSDNHFLTSRTLSSCYRYEMNDDDEQQQDNNK